MISEGNENRACSSLDLLNENIDSNDVNVDGERVNLLDISFPDEDSDDYVVSEYESSCDSPCSLDSDEEIGYSRSKKGSKMNTCKPNVDYNTLTFEIGMKFKDVRECKEEIRNSAVVRGYSLKWKKSDAKKLEARCEGNCPFMLYASKLKHEETFVIKSMVDTHTCVRKSYNRQANSDWLASIITPVLKRRSNYPAKDMILDVQLKYGIIVNEDLCYVAKKKALENLWGSYESHYSRLRPYIAHLQIMDREGTFMLKTFLNDCDQPVFQRVYLGFSSLRKGFLVGCRRCICFDACFIKNAIGGALLAAIAKDCNGKMWPISWAVIEKEAEVSWTWFFTHLFKDLDINDGLGWTFMSDKHKSIINGISALAPLAEHRHCARHVYANWKKQFAGKKFKDMFWDAVKSTNQSTFNVSMEKLKALSQESYEQFMQREPRTFCRSLISTFTRTNTIDNNICESFNSYILKFRDQPIIDMLEKIRKSLISRMPEIVKSLEASSSVVCPDVIKKLRKLQKHVQNCMVIQAMDQQFEVQIGNEVVNVDLNAKRCTCRLWSLTGIPCCHGLACINYLRDDPIRYVDEFYHRSNCLAAYRHFVSPILGPQDWPNVDALPILPPPFIKQPERPKKNRIRVVDEEPRQVKQKLSLKDSRIGCIRCKQVGHNVRTCRMPAPVQNETDAPPKRPVGRPKKPLSTTRKSGTTPVERGELAQARTGFGVLTGHFGNIYVRPPGARHTTLYRHQDVGASQSSQVINSSTLPS